MISIILAAGSSTRLRPLTDETPKCLLPVGDKPLLQRTIEHVFNAGVTDIQIVVGFGAEKIRSFVRSAFPGRRIAFTMNPEFDTTNNAYSLLLARKCLEGEDGAVARGFLLLDSDILFPWGLLPLLLRLRAENRIAVRVRGAHDPEEIRVSVAEGNRIVEIGKEIPMDVSYGESLGIEVFSPSAAVRLFRILEDRVRNGSGRTEFYEAAFQQMIDEGVELTAIDVSDHPAIEIDTMDDLEEARSMVRDL